ncbi:MAG: hypothetical protein Q9181_001369 [Wetmoreana brouardii]
MDINSLLSPQDSPKETATSSSNSTPRKPRKLRGPKSARPAGASPASRSPLPPPALAQNATLQPFPQIVQSPPITHPASAMRRAADALSDGGRSARQGSTPGMDTLADLASMQHHQQTTRANAGGLRTMDIYDNQGSGSGAVLTSVHGPLTRRATLDHATVDPPSQTASVRTLTTKNLSETDLQAAAQLVAYLATNQFAYSSHVQLIDLLHRGFRSHTQISSSTTTKNHFHAYGLLSDLRSAREAMDARFAVGEQLWVDWIEDEQLLATTFDECIAVMELCYKAVQEEPGSTKLWSLYASWMTSLYVTATSDAIAREVVDHAQDIQDWSAEDKVVAGEVCNRQQMMDVWARGARATKWRLDESHLLWNPYTELLLQDLARSSSSDGIDAMRAHFRDRLQTPHETWDHTFQMFSNFTSHYENQSYEGIMMTVNQQCAATKTTYGAREMLEIAIRKAHAADDRAAQLSKFTEYIDWETGQSRNSKKHVFVFELVDALYQRALLSFPANTELWEAYVIFLNEQIVSDHRRDVDLLPILDRATRHCPWSGSLWSQYLLAAERQRMPFPDIGQIKHKATSTGLLDEGGLEEVLQVYVAWCSILRRCAFQEESTDEELDVAEVGILASIEDMQRLGEAKYGEEYQGDPNYRLERIYIKYLTQSRNWHGARGKWKSLIPSWGDSHEFWLRYYIWEMCAWGVISCSENAANAPCSPRPSEATKVLRTALRRPKLDWPERLIQILQYHCEDNEDAAEIQSASVQIWKAKIAVKQRREKEATEAYEAAQTHVMFPVQSLNPEASADPAVSFSTSKRKRDDETNEPEDEGAPKKPRANEDLDSGEKHDPALAASNELRRDRENATIIVKNLPQITTEARVRQYFRDCGTINSLLLSIEEPSETITATIEFESQDDALTAQTKDKKDFDGQEIEVQVGSGSTVFAANFPPTADEHWIRETFGHAGEIIDVRFPSLKYNTHRRFCYIQFNTAEQARKATALDGQLVGSKLKLVAKISDPGQRKNRTGALYEGREIHILNLDWAVTEAELEDIFSKYGKVEKARIPADLSGKSKGFAFVAFSNKDEANAALDMNNTKLKRRIMTVELAKQASAKRRAMTIVRDTSQSVASLSPDVQTANGDHPTAASPAGSVANEEAKPTSAEIKARTIALLNVPDTVNDARIRAIAERYGSLVKITLRPDHQGAILEYKDVSDAGKAALGLDGYEITPGRSLGVGDVGEMLKQKAEKKYDKPGSQAGKKTKSLGVPQSSMPIRRPAVLGAKRGGRGGLSSIPRAPAVAAKNKEKEDDGTEVNLIPNTSPEGGAKSNADFKAMFLGKKNDA